MRFNKISLAAMVLGGSLFMAACGGDSSSTQLPSAAVATADTPAVIDKASGNGAAVVAAVLNKTFTFPNGVESLFGTSTSTTLTLSGEPTAPSFSITEGTGSAARTATGTMEFGSCIFTVASTSPFTAPHPLAALETITVESCLLTIGTDGKTAGSEFDALVSLVLNGLASAPVTLSVSINATTGQVTVNGSVVGRVELDRGTGGAGIGG